MLYFEYIQELEVAQGNNEKVKILKEAINQCHAFREYIQLCYDPFVNTFVRKVDPDIKPLGILKPGDAFYAAAAILKSTISHNKESVDAIEEVLEQSSHEEQEYIYRLVKRDMRVGISTKLINKAEKGFIFTFDVALATPLEDNKINFPCDIEPKLDGIRCLAFVNYEQQDVRFFSRNGKALELDESFAKELLATSSQFSGTTVVFDGELMGTDFQHLMTQARRKYNNDQSELKYYVFDILPLSEFEAKRSRLDLAHRSQLLGSVFSRFISVPRTRVFKVPAYTCNTKEQMDYFFEEFLKQGYEGAVIKDLRARYECKRSKAWFKLKPHETWDGPIVQVLEGSRGTDLEGTLGAFAVNIDGVVVNVGSGFSRAERDVLWGIKDKLIGKCVEVKGDCKTNDGSIRFPTFVQFRPDKD